MAKTNNIDEILYPPKVYCPNCGKDKILRFFYGSKQEIHNNETYHQKYPICKQCIKNKVYNEKTGQLDKAEFKKMLQKLDLPFKNDVYLTALEDRRESFGTYISLLNTAYRQRQDMMCWADGETEEKKEQINQQIINNIDNSQITKEMMMTWGRGFDIDEYEFLDNELEEWKKTYKYGKRAELILLKEICTTLLRIRKATEAKEDVSKLQKDLQDLLKTASIDPAKANIADNGKSLDAFGVWIKDIEAKRPAEWFEEQEKYKDMDGFSLYIENYIVRPIRNFLTGTRDFQINDSIDVDLDGADIGQNDEGDDNGNT